MTFVKKTYLTVSEAKELIHSGFVLKFIGVGFGKDSYEVYVVGK